MWAIKTGHTHKIGISSTPSPTLFQSFSFAVAMWMPFHGPIWSISHPPLASDVSSGWPHIKVWVQLGHSLRNDGITCSAKKIPTKNQTSPIYTLNISF